MRFRKMAAWVMIFMMIPCFCLASGNWYTVTVWDDTIVQQATSDGFADINT